MSGEKFWSYGSQLPVEPERSPQLGQARGPPHQLCAGQRVGRYEVVEFLGDGGMGSVFRARDPELGRDVALKLVSDHGNATGAITL